MMRLGVWGIGGIGTGVACRLATTSFTSELVLINKDANKAQARAFDITHGLAFAPSCRRVRAASQEHARDELEQIDLLVVTAGVPVKPGGNRANLYPDNNRMLQRVLIPALEGYRGIVLMVTNPVDRLTRDLVICGGLDARRALGLGTVVETARLRAALASNARRPRPPHDVSGFVVGTHDERCVPLPDAVVTVGTRCSREDVADAHVEVINAANKVKQTGGARDDGSAKIATLHPIVEGVVAVAAAIAGDAHRTLTVSMVDEHDPDRLAYSVPCVLGRDGVVERLPIPTGLLDTCLAKLRGEVAPTSSPLPR